MPKHTTKKRVGIALGGGAARGWAHIGVLQELTQMGIAPDIVCGTSIGSFVGAAYVTGQLDMLDDWARNLNTLEIIRYLDIKFTAGGGLADGKRLIDFFAEHTGHPLIEDLPGPFCAVATELHTGHETWIKRGPLWDAVRASIALPGLLTPWELNDQWLVDGGLVNPVPVSVCRALGAEVIIAVNLNGDLAGCRRVAQAAENRNRKSADKENGLLDKLTESLKGRAQFLTQWLEPGDYTPGLLDVFADSLDIMLNSITRSRLAGDPPDVVLTPKLGLISLLEFDRAHEAIEIGRASTTLMAAVIRDALDIDMDADQAP